MNPNPDPTPPTTTGRRNNQNRHHRRWLPYAGAVALAALLAAGLWPKPVPVETARVSKGFLRATINEEGKTRIKQRYVISAPVAGQLRRLPFKAGAEVKAGETVLAVIDSLAPALLDARSRAQAEARLDTAKANLDKARANHEFMASELLRYKKLFANKTVAVQELETAQMRETTTAKEKASAESALRQAEAELAAYAAGNGESAVSPNPPIAVKAPCSGRILRVYEENSRVVSAGTPLMEIGDPADLEVVIEVLSRDGAAISPGAKVILDQWGGGEPLEAQVRLVEPAAFTKVSALGVEEQRVNVIADLTTPPDRRHQLGDQFRVDAKIVVWETNDAIKVPSGGVFRRGQQWLAFVATDGRAQLRTVKVGRASGSETQITDGLREGEQVILYPGDRVREGLRVKQILL